MAGPPDIADAAVTALMNAGLQKQQLYDLSAWLTDNGRAVGRLREALAAAQGLSDMSEDSIVELASFLDLFDVGRVIPRFRLARVCKWLAAWAPAHVPMLDSLVREALTGGGEATSIVLLRRIQSLLQTYDGGLSAVGLWVQGASGGRLSKPLPPVRILDCLIWFDWWVSDDGSGTFKRWIRVRDSNAGEHDVTARALTWENSASPLIQS